MLRIPVLSHEGMKHAHEAIDRAGHEDMIFKMQVEDEDADDDDEEQGDPAEIQAMKRHFKQVRVRPYMRFAKGICRIASTQQGLVCCGLLKQSHIALILAVNCRCSNSWKSSYRRRARVQRRRRQNKMMATRMMTRTRRMPARVLRVRMASAR